MSTPGGVALPPIAVHHTATVDEPWEGPANEARLSNDAGEATFRREYAWTDPDGDPDTKAAYKFPHHQVSEDGSPGAANIAGCRAIMSRVGGADIPDDDRPGVEAHAQAHMDDHEGEGAEEGAAEAVTATQEPAAAAPAARRYSHLLHAVYEHPWALTPQMLGLITDVLDFRAAGGFLTADEIQTRIAAADNGPRNGGAVTGGVAVIPLYGLISQRQGLMSDTSGGTSCEAIRASLREAVADPDVRAIVFDVDSPGGDVAGVPELAADIREARLGSKPIVAVSNTLMASAAYWIAAQCDELVASPSAMVGSIGIVGMHEDISAAEAKAGVKTTLISSGAYKTEGNPYEPLTDDARATLQGQCDAYYAMFLADVGRGRGVTTAQVEAEFGQGRVLMAAQAARAGLVDRVDTLEGTVRRLARGGGSKSRARAATDVIPFSEHAAAVASDANALAAHAAERARLRAKEGRPALSASTSSALRDARNALSRALATVDPTTSGSPLARAVKARGGSRSVQETHR
jgi:signal peptide peptidase SppA